jgi:hypothetical protein
MIASDCADHPRAKPRHAVRQILEWYFEKVYGKFEGPGVLPFYCDPSRVGRFAVAADDLVAGRNSDFFKLFVAQAMFQARRDVLIMKQQREMPRDESKALISSAWLARRTRESRCPTVESASSFDRECSVTKTADGGVDCAHQPGAACHVKEATVLFNRVGDMGKLPTSAWLHLVELQNFNSLVDSAVSASADPASRADLLVAKLSQVHRVGRKLATMFVSALSTPALAPGLTPWFPRIDGNALTVVDTNVARAVAALRSRSDSRRSYDAISFWIRREARRVDLRLLRRTLPAYSPRLVQQALYAFCSRSNRLARRDDCAVTPCRRCVTRLCPFAAQQAGTSRRHHA